MSATCPTAMQTRKRTRVVRWPWVTVATGEGETSNACAAGSGRRMYLSERSCEVACRGG
jgi:hypothetical protein